MPFSSYQIERLLDRLRRWRAFFHWPNATDTSVDKVTLTVLDEERKPPAPKDKGPIPKPRIAEIASSKAFHPIVERELERRAATFVKAKPKQKGRTKAGGEDSGKKADAAQATEATDTAAFSTPPIPKTRRGKPRPPPESLGEGD